ncbi:restriction endonuclease subunit S [uncultured Prevotella sp.]|uniref:restriction endonuclease subunit S n=1 Tax=uncultured Prevotella sp. TaxID=159272 RepID=UPI0027E361F2|nr:restriction endonuclease subunit S [uncultured Prevotella sp.]
MTTKINNEHKKLNVPNKQEQNQTCLDSAEREGLRPKGNVPNLRFPEFQGEWEELGLSELLDFKNGLNPKPDKFGKGIKFISVMDILNNAVITYDCIKASVDVTEKELSDFSVEKGDILFQRSSETLEDVGRANVYMDDKTAVFGGFVIRGKKKGEYDPQYFNYLLRSPFARKRIIPMGAGAQHFNIGQEGLSKVKLHFANIEEQKKIGKMLSLLDERIATQNKIIDKLQSLIKGISNKLLNSKEGMLVRLGAILKERSEKTKKNNQYAVLSSTVNGLFSQRDYFSKDIASENNVGYKIIRLHDVVLSPQNLWMGNINYNDKFDIGIVSPSYKVFLISDNYDKRYVAAMLKTHRALYDYQLISEQGASVVRRNLNLESFGQLVFRIPLIDKQREIGKTISLLKSRLETESMLRAAYQSQKQYLLRQMFI